MKNASLENLLLPIILTWWLRFCAKYSNHYFEEKPVEFGTCYQFFGLQCSLTREQTKDVAKVFEEFGWVRIERNGWRILKLEQANPIERCV